MSHPHRPCHGCDGAALRHVASTALTLLAALAAACSALPGRYSPEQLERVGGELTDADSIYAELGPPDLRREDARLWVYAWEDPVPYPSRSFVVLEFEADGKLSNREVALAVRPSQGGLSGFRQSARYCTEGGTCIEHGIATDSGIRFDAPTYSVTPSSRMTLTRLFGFGFHGLARPVSASRSLPVLRDLLPSSHKHPPNPVAVNALAAAAPSRKPGANPSTP